MANSLVIGDRAIAKILDELPNNIRRIAVSSAAQKGGKVIAARAKQLVDITTNYKHSDDGFSRAKYIRKSIKSVRFSNRGGRKTSLGGASVKVAGKDLPVGKRFWPPYAYAALLAFGRKVDKGTGTTRGKGDFVEEAGAIAGRRGILVFKKNLTPEIRRAKDRTVKRYARRTKL